ncbi:MAG: hypothetical protein HY721_34570, partial [Planctomycetes bacterium]|nr:hypothetical protein [Planctomycetota bacterium]
MKCEEFLERHDLLRDVESWRGTLPSEELEALRRHRGECDRCRAEALEGDEVAAMLRALPALEPPALDGEPRRR